jgi:hypothetical protein
MRPAVLIVPLAVGVALGLWHLWLAGHAIFVFREGEPLWSWVFILSGPGATLVCVIVAAWRQRVGGYLLIVLAIASTSILAIAKPEFPVMVGDLGKIAFPMAALGLAFVFLGRQSSAVASSSVSNGA